MISPTKKFHLTTHYIHDRQTDMPPAGFESHSGKRAVADRRLSFCRHWNRQLQIRRIFISVPINSQVYIMCKILFDLHVLFSHWKTLWQEVLMRHVGMCVYIYIYIYIYIYMKVKWSHYKPGVAQKVGRVIPLLFHDRGTRRRWVVTSTPRPHFTPRKDPVPILHEAGWAPGPVWTDGKSRPHRDSIPDRPAHSSVTILTELPGPLLCIYIYMCVCVCVCAWDLRRNENQGKRSDN